MDTKKILLLSAYDAKSHRYWRESLQAQFPNYDWTVLALPDRHFLWRAHGNGLSLGLREQETLNQPYDLLIATSMCDLATLRGLVPNLSRFPNHVYFHENQFAYPINKQNKSSLLLAQTLNLYTALAADKVFFNTKYNQDSFLAGVTEFLGKMPDYVPQGVEKSIEEKSDVLCVPLENKIFSLPSSSRVNTPLEIVWNHRWEYDKAPERFFEALKQLHREGYDFKLHIVGQNFRKWPDCFHEAQTLFSDHTLTWGKADTEHYYQILSNADIVVSTALHDFQGLAMLEACILGCIPVVPNRCAYPEIFPELFQYQGNSTDPKPDIQALTSKLKEVFQQPDLFRRQRPDLKRFSWAQQHLPYQELISFSSSFFSK